MGAPIGNQNAAKAKEWELALKRAMARKANGDFRGTLDEIAAVVVDAALMGEKDAWREVADRMDGKPAQGMTVSGDPEKPLVTLVERVIVDHVTN